MSDIATAAELAATAATGGVVGLVGSVLSKGFGLFENSQEYKLKKLQYEQELALLDRQMSAEKLRVDSQERIADSADAAKIKEAAYVHDSSFGTASQWVVNVQKLVRPGLTIYLLMLVTWLWFQNDTLTGDMRMEIVRNILWASNFSLGFWFGERSLNFKKGM